MRGPDEALKQLPMHTSHTIALPNRPPLQLGRRALVMGILNVTPDSFSDGGAHHRLAAALSHAHQMLDEGVDIIDIGGESTRPGATPVGVQEELDRVIPVIDALVAQDIPVPLSIDTYKPLVADQAIQAGASIINDVHGLMAAPEMAAVAGLHDVPVVITHWDESRDRSLPLMGEMQRHFALGLERAEKAGVKPERILLDPGFGFAKSVADNYQLLAQLGEIGGGKYPILVGTSRKSMIGKLLDLPADERLAGTIATTVLAYRAGGHIFRVHDVRANREALRVAEATLYGPPADLG